MIVYYIDLDNTVVKQSTYTEIGNLMAFYEEMDNYYQDGWWETFEEAEEALQELFD